MISDFQIPHSLSRHTNSHPYSFCCYDNTNVFYSAWRLGTDGDSVVVTSYCVVLFLYSTGLYHCCSNHLDSGVSSLFYFNRTFLVGNVVPPQYCFGVVRASVRSSVRLSIPSVHTFVCREPYLNTYWSDLIHFWYK